jgi:sugar phosphate isomerase/epimerase
MSQRVRIGNQTAIACPDALTPFRFALEHGFDAFEWFEDRKTTSGGSLGWDESDIDADTRHWIRSTGADRDVLFSVHAPWQANPLYAEGVRVLLRSLDFARDIGAALVNLHLYMDEGAVGYVRGLAPVARAASSTGLRLSIENTPHTTPRDFNETFAQLSELEGVAPGTLGMCLTTITSVSSTPWDRRSRSSTSTRTKIGATPTGI